MVNTDNLTNKEASTLPELMGASNIVMASKIYGRSALNKTTRKGANCSKTGINPG